MISQQQQLNAQKTKNKSKSNNSSNELVPYNLNGKLGSLGGGYNSTPLSLGGDYSYTPTLEPTVYEPTLESVEDEIIEETDTPTVSEPIVSEVVEPTAPNEQCITEVTVTPPANEPAINEASKFDVTTAAYKGKKIAFFVEKYLQCKPTYNYSEENDKQILTVDGNGLFIRFEKVGGGDYDCAKITLNGQDRKDLLNTIFEINEGDSNNHVVIPPEPTIPGPTIPDPSLNQPSSKPVEEPTPEQPKDDKVETEDNTSVTPPPVTPPPVTAPPEEQEVVVG